MKTYSFEVLEKFLENGSATLKSKQVGNKTFYLDDLKNGEYSVSIDDRNVGIHEDLDRAKDHYNALCNYAKI